MRAEIGTYVSDAIKGFSVVIPRDPITETVVKPLIKERWLPRSPKLFAVDKSDQSGIHRIEFDGLKAFTIPHLPDKILAYSPYVEINDEPEKHPLSSSLYYAEMEIGQDIFMISYLPPGQLTSPLHWHLERMFDQKTTVYLPLIIEFYELAYGSAKIHHEEGDAGYEVPEFFSVDPGIRHRMEAGPEGALFSILMKNAALYPPELRHIHY